MRTEDELLATIAALRRGAHNGRRAAHKPLLLLWALGQWAQTGQPRFPFVELDEPVSELITEFGEPASEQHRAYLPFFHLEDSLWVKHDAPERARAKLRGSGASGELHPDLVAALERDAAFAGRVARAIVAANFTESYAGPLGAATGLGDLSAAEDREVAPTRRRRRAALREEALVTYGYCCAMCGWDGRMVRDPVAVEVAHVRWHAFDGPDVLTNVMALYSLHHRLFDLGVLGLGAELEIVISPRFNAKSAVAEALVHRLGGQEVRQPRSSSDGLDREQVAWHTDQVFKDRRAA